MSLYDLLRAEVARDGARPFLTFYDDATGERVELSVVTFDNWVAKTANFLQDGLGVSAGGRVGIDLPAHWQSLVWVMAAWAVGAELVPVGSSGVDAAVVGPDGADADAPEVVALALRPMGGRFVAALPGGVYDYALEVPGYGDRFAPRSPVGGDAPAWEGATQADVLTRASARSVPAGARRLLNGAGLDLDLAVDSLVAPLQRAGSTVLVRNADPARYDARVAQERVTGS